MFRRRYKGPARGAAVNRHVGLPVPVPRGQFAEAGAPPNSPLGGVIAELLGGLSGDPGIRVGTTTASSRKFSGTLDTVQRFTRPAAPNADHALEMSAMTAGLARRTLSQTRGRPGGRR